MTNRILLLEDVPALDSFLFTSLSPLAEIIRSRSTIEAIVQAERFDPTLLVCDARVGDLEGVSLVREIRRECPNVPMIVMTREADANTVIALIRAGAQDVLPRSTEVAELQAIVIRAIETSARRAQREMARRQEAVVPPDHVPISLNLTLEEAVDQFIAAKLERTGGSVPRAAKELAISPSTLYRRLDKQRV